MIEITVALVLGYLAMAYVLNSMIDRMHSVEKTLKTLTQRIECLQSNDTPQMRIIPQQDLAPKKPPSPGDMDKMIEQLNGMY